MDRIQKNFGFGFMRLPMAGEEVDISQTTKMVDAFLEAGFNYFDTAHGYLQGKSERALKTCLTSRYPREKYILTNKLTANFFQTEEDIRPFFESQLEACGVDYFDFYLMHAQGAGNYPHFQECHAYEIAQELKAEGKVRHVGISFHDSAEMLEKILTDHPEVEVVQIQFNYLDYEDPAVQSRRCYEVCRKYGKPVIVMEPVKGGNLVNLPEEARAVLDALHGGSPASYAIRFAAGFPGMLMVLSGMSTLEQVEDNLAFMKDFQPLNERQWRRSRPSSTARTSSPAPPAATAPTDVPSTSPSRTSSPPGTPRSSTRTGTLTTTTTSAPPRAAGLPTACSAASARRSAPSTCPSGSCCRRRPGSLRSPRHKKSTRQAPPGGAALPFGGRFFPGAVAFPSRLCYPMTRSVKAVKTTEGGRRGWPFPRRRTPSSGRACWRRDGAAPSPLGCARPR